MARTAPDLQHAALPQHSAAESSPAGKDTAALTDDWFLDGRLLLRQPAKGHRIGTDALLLAAATPPLARVCDLGSGVGAVGLALHMAGAQTVVMVERDAVFAACARHNIVAEKREATIAVAEVDIFDRKAVLREPVLADQSFDAVATNPPYDQVLRGRRSPTKLKNTAHAMEGGTLADWLICAVRLLKDGGVLTMIHRADRLDDVLAAIPARAGGIVIRPVQPKIADAATRILVAATAGSRAPLALLPPLVLHEANGAFTPEGALLHKGRAALGMQPGIPLLVDQ